MDHGQRTMIADKFQWVFSESLLNACAKDVRFGKRQRIITPFRLGLALTATCASQRVETLADFHCGFNALFGTTVTYKAFYNQVAKPHFADFARTMAASHGAPSPAIGPIFGPLLCSFRTRLRTGCLLLFPAEACFQPSHLLSARTLVQFIPATQS